MTGLRRCVLGAQTKCACAPEHFRISEGSPGRRRPRSGRDRVAVARRPQSRSPAMKALVWHKPTDIRCETVPDPKIEHPRDAIIRVTSCAICGSDLHLYNGFMPGMKNGDIMGHEFMGEVVEVGPRGQGQAQGRRPRRRALHDHLRRVRAVPARQFLGLRDAPTATRTWPTRSSATRPRACSATPI